MKQSTYQDMPASITDLVGHEHEFTGHVISRSEKFTEPTKFHVLKARWGSGVIINMKTLKPIHPSFQLLLKREGMKKAQWSQSFPCREIVLKDEEE